ncbi:hypothetical protein L7F22_022236, partial [Adiantum nelumboides]|nr:hypothetical protein [Adiantum nelumboides]
DFDKEDFHEAFVKRNCWLNGYVLAIRFPLVNGAS